MKFLAFDLALNHFGWALVDSDWDIPDEFGAMRNPYNKPTFPLGQRLAWLEANIGGVVFDAVELRQEGTVEVWKEGAVGASFQVLKTAPVHGVFDYMLWRGYGHVPREVSPRSIKVLATNDGGTKTTKDAMVAAAGLYLGFTVDPTWTKEMAGDAADALWIADFAARLAGVKRPALPPAHLRALTIEEP